MFNAHRQLFGPDYNDSMDDDSFDTDTDNFRLGNDWSRILRDGRRGM